MASKTVVPINTDTDVVAARQKGRELATELGFVSTDSTLLATAISELARNIVRYAKCGEILIASVQSGDRVGITVVARDKGPEYCQHFTGDAGRLLHVRWFWAWACPA